MTVGLAESRAKVRQRTLQFRLLQLPQRGPHHVTGVLIPPALQLLRDETLEMQVLQTSQETVELSSMERSNVRSNERTVERTDVRKSRRVIRHTFDIYQDQLVALKTLQFKAVQTDNKKVTLGDMVQEAIDLWLKQR